MAFNATIAALLADGEQEPLFVFKHLSSPVQSATTEWAYHSDAIPDSATRNLASDPVTDNWKPYLVKFKPSRSSVNPLTGKLTQSDIKVELLSTSDHVLTKLVGTEDPAGTDPITLFEDVGVYIGFRGLNWLSWEPIFNGKIIDVRLTKGGAVWEVTATSALSKARGNAMSNASSTDLLEGGDMDSWDGGTVHEWTKNTGGGSSTVVESTRPRNQHTEGGSAARFNFDVSGSQAELMQNVTVAVSSVYTLDVWAKGTAASLPMEVGFYNTTTTNWCQVAETTPGAATVTSTWGASETYLTLTPGNGEHVRSFFRFKTEASGTDIDVYIRGQDSALGSQEVYVDDVMLTQRVAVRGHPVDLALAILGSPSDSPNLTWLSGEPTGAGLSVSVSESVPGDLFGTTFTTERDLYLADDTIEVVFDEPVQALSYLEEQFFRLWGYLYIGPKGMLCFRGYHAPPPTTDYVSLVSSNISKMSGWRRRYDLMVNSVVVEGDYTEGAEDKFTELARVEDSAGITADGLKQTLIRSKWIQTWNGGSVVATSTANRLFAQMSRAREEVKVEVQQSLLDVNGSDTAELTDANLPDIVNRTRGLTGQLFEVLSVSPNLLRGKVALVLMRSFYDRPGFIAPSGHPDYTSATDAEKQYGFISDNADDEMSNGDPTYKVQ